MKAPPFLPEETLYRVLRVANFNGLCVLAFSGMMTLAVASTGNYVGAAIGLLVAASGALELHGAGLLRAGDARGMQWLVASQPFLLIVILGYCALQLMNTDPEVIQLIHKSITDEQRAILEQEGYSEEQFKHMVYSTTFTVLAVLTFIYQGLMTLYYYRRMSTVAVALDEDSGERRFN